MLATDTVLYPQAPTTLEDTGLSGDLVLQIVTKTLHLAGELSGSDLSERLGVSFQIIEPALALLKREHHCEISGGSVLGGPSFRYRLTDAGRIRAALFLEHDHYIGALPVPLDQYTTYMKQFASEHLQPSRAAIRGAFSHLVLNRRVLDQLGPAIAAQHSLFVYGPPGNGKTVISQAIRDVLPGDIVIPHALSIDGHIIRIYDLVNHQRVEHAAEHSSLAREDVFDARWVRCRRPLITVGGELTLDGLELGFSVATGLYRAPLQVLANGGVLVIDDFGRQQCPAQAILSRWIVPLESGIDFLTLRTGQKFEVPFHAFVVFATNLKPSELVDEAFLRRIHYKVLAESPTDDEFVRIFENYCRGKAVDFNPSFAHHVLYNELKPRGIKARACHPRDLIEHSLSIASYLDLPRVLTTDLLSEACATYFVADRDLATV
jgi:magnesium chelatase subunit ChlI-like protein